MSGIYNGEFRAATDLSAIARGAADAIEANDVLTAFLPSIETYDLDYDLSAGVAGLPMAASFRAYDATAPYGREQSVGAKKGSLPASSVKHKVGELQRLRFRQASTDAFGAELEKKAKAGGQSIAVRAILARAEAIATGKVTLSGENGLTVEIAFGRDATLSVAPGTAWSNIAAPALTDILGWQDVYRGFNGGNAAGLITSSQTLADLSVNTQLIARAMRSTSSGLTRVSREDVLSVLAEEGITDVLVYDEQYTNAAGTKVRAIAADKFLLTPPADAGLGDAGSLGATQWGVPAEALNERYGVPEQDRPGIFAGHFDYTDPESTDVLSSSIFLPVLQEYNAVLDATVR
jgi:hypothetical protein